MLLRHLLREGWNSFVGDSRRIWRRVVARSDRAVLSPFTSCRKLIPVPVLRHEQSAPQSPRVDNRR